MQERITGKAQRIFDWRDPEFIRRKVMLETNLAMVKQRAAGGGGGGGGGRSKKRARRGGGGKNIYSNRSSINNMMREQKWSNAGDSRPSIPEYDVTRDPHSIGWTRTRTFKQSPYSKMVQDSNSLLPASFSDIPRHKQHEELAMQVQAQIAAERVSAATEAVAECEARQERQKHVDRSGNGDGNRNGAARPSTPAQQIEAEIELFRTIILREGLLGMAASLAAEVVAGDLSKLGKPRTEMAEEHSFLSRLETKLPDSPVGFLQQNEARQEITPLTLLSILDQLRCTTVRTVEALSNWQKRRLEVEAREIVQSETRGNFILDPGNKNSSNTLNLGPERIPFIWDGVNYLLKIATDVDFLDSVRPLRRTLGYPLIRNPFITPFSLDQLPPDPGPPAPLLPLTANASTKELRVAGGGRAVDSVRIFRSSVAILEEESAFMFGSGGDGGGQRMGPGGALLPDWNSAARGSDPSNASAKDTRAVLRRGLGIDIGGREIDEERREAKRPRVMGNRIGGRSGPRGHKTVSTAGSSAAAYKLHPQDYAAVKRKTGVTRSDITALVVYSVPPAGVKLALEALRTLLHPQCDQRNGTKATKRKKSIASQQPLPRAMDLEWSSLRRLAMDRENLLRCMLQYTEAVPLSSSEKRRAMMGYLNDPTFDPDVVVRQSESASKVVHWVRRVILSSLRAEKESGRPQPSSTTSLTSTNIDRISPKAKNTWGFDDDGGADDEGGDDEDDYGGEGNGGGGANMGRVTKKGHSYRLLQSELSQLKSSLRNRGVLSDEEGDDHQSDDEGREQRRKSYSRRRRLRSRGGGSGGSNGNSSGKSQGNRTLLRTSRRIPCEDKNIDSITRGESSESNSNFGTIYAVVTCSMRYDDGWLVVTAHEPGGVSTSMVQLHPTYTAMLLDGTSLRDLSDMPAGDQRDRRMEKVLDHLVASHQASGSLASAPSSTKQLSSIVGGSERKSAQLLLRFAFSRSLLTGIRRIPMSMDHQQHHHQQQQQQHQHGGVQQHTAYLALRVEFIDGSDVPRRVPWSAPSEMNGGGGDLRHDGGVVIFGWVHRHDCTPLHERKSQHEGTADSREQETSSPLVLVISDQELRLLFSHKDHLLRQGDVRAQKELARVLVNRLLLRVSLESRDREEGTPVLRLDIERGIPMAIQGQGIVSVPHMPVPLNGQRKHSHVRLTGRVEHGGHSLMLGIRSVEDGIDSGHGRSGRGTLRLTVVEMAALAAVTATQALRLPPALGRVLDRMYYNEEEEVFNIDRSLVTMQCRISDEMLTVDVEVTPVGLSFRVTRIDERGQPHATDPTSLKKIVRWDDAKRLLERAGERDIHDLLLPEKSATLAERICTMLRLVEKDGASLGNAEGSTLGTLGQKPASLSDYRLETAMFRRMVNVMVAIEEIDDGTGTPPNNLDNPNNPPRPVGSITIDDSATLAQARSELEEQLRGHVNLPETFRFTWRGRPFTRAQEYFRTIAECLPSLQLRPVATHMVRRPGGGSGGGGSSNGVRRVPGGGGRRGGLPMSLVGMPLEDIVEEYYDDDGGNDYYSSDNYVSGSVLGGPGGGKRSNGPLGHGHRGGGRSDTEQYTVGGGRAGGRAGGRRGGGHKRNAGRHRSAVAAKNARKRSSKIKKGKGLSSKNKKKNKKKQKGGGHRPSDSADITATSGGSDEDDLEEGSSSAAANPGGETTAADGSDAGGGGDDSTASEDDFEELDVEALSALGEDDTVEYNNKKRLSEVRRFEEVDEETLSSWDEEKKTAYEALKIEAKKYREDRVKRKKKEGKTKGKKKKGKKKKKKKKGKKGKKVPAFMRMNTSKMEALKAKKGSRKAKLAKAEEDKKAKEEAAKKKKRKARPKSAEEPDFERLPGSVTVEAGSKLIITTEVLAGVPLDRQSRIRIGKKRTDGSLENLYWISQDSEDIFGGEDGKTLTLRRPYNDWSEAALRIYLVKGELALEPEEEAPKGDEIREDELNRKEKFFGYEIMWVDIIPMLGTEPIDLHQTKELWYPKVTCAFAAKKVFKHLCANIKPVAKELDGSKFTKFAKGLPDVVDGKKIKTTDIDIIFAKSKAKDQRRLKFKEFFNSALVSLAELRYPWLEKCGEMGGEGPACREFIRQHIFKWDICAELVQEVCL